MRPDDEARLSRLFPFAIYSLGLGVPFLLAAAFTDVLARRLRGFARVGRTLQFVVGGIMVVMGIAVMTGRLTDYPMADTPARNTVSANPGMSCPTCQVALVMSEHQGIEIDYCPRCGGIWLDRGELDKILERSASYQQPERSAPAYSPAPSRPPYPDEHHCGHGGYGHGHKRRKSFIEDLFD